ncbi:MAG: phosphoribosylformylglycinamidine synthase subunit PurS [Thermoplasmata archaeon]|nr:phosphoribosylformylglycinamidine synthase subunit PurS [Thermoplasmata archaeon]HHH78312.1 phosphoribosylformylglycinamidine synthase, purS protein [Thermoplasmatales archaeon]
MFRARVEIRLKKGISDPEGKNILKAVHLLGFEGVKDVGVAKVIELLIDAESREDAARRADMMCQRLLTNPVIHDYTVEVEEVNR